MSEIQRPNDLSSLPLIAEASLGLIEAISSTKPPITQIAFHRIGDNHVELTLVDSQKKSQGYFLIPTPDFDLIKEALQEIIDIVEAPQGKTEVEARYKQTFGDWNI